MASTSKHLMNKFAAALSLILCAPLAALAGPVTNLVNNGSFEADPMAAGSWNISSNLTGWTGGANGIELRDNVAGTASKGVNFVELDTWANSSMSQQVSTLLGQWYVLSFDYSNRTDTAALTNGLAWSLGGASGSAPLQAAVTGGNQWQHYSTLVQANSTSMTLNFSATGTSDGFGTSLDNVSLTQAVPEPASFALVLAGLGVMAIVTRRRLARP